MYHSKKIVLNHQNNLYKCICVRCVRTMKTLSKITHFCFWKWAKNYFGEAEITKRISQTTELIPVPIPALPSVLCALWCTFPCRPHRILPTRATLICKKNIFRISRPIRERIPRGSIFILKKLNVPTPPLKIGKLAPRMWRRDIPSTTACSIKKQNI